MPLYEYKCDSCGAVFELIQKFSDSPLTTHEGCGGHVERLVSAAALRFKGTGWYVTDYAHKNGASGATGPKTEKASETAGKNGAAKSDAASATPSSASAKPDKK